MSDPLDFLRQKTNPSSFIDGEMLLRTKSVLDLRISNGNILSRVINNMGRMENCQITTKGHFINSRCSCGINMSGVLCSHALATMLLFQERYPERYEDLIRSEDEDDAAAYASATPKAPIQHEESQRISIDPKALRKILALDEKLRGLLRLRFEDLPDSQQEWDRISFTVDLIFDERVFSCNNISRLATNEIAASKMMLTDFSLQDQGIILFLHRKAMRKGSSYSMNSLDMADLLHLLIGHHHCYYQDKPINFFHDKAQLSLEARQEGKYYYLKTSLLINGQLFSLNEPASLVGRTGLWIGQNHQFYWMPAQLDIALLKSLLASEEVALPEEVFYNWQEYSSKNQHNLPTIAREASEKVVAQEDQFTALLQLDLRNQIIQGRLSFEYNNTLVANDQELVWDGSSYIARDYDAEEDSRQTLIEAGFETSDIDSSSFFLSEAQCIGEFIFSVLPELENHWKIFQSDLFTHYLKNIDELQISASAEEENNYWIDINLNFSVNDQLKAKWSDLLRAVNDGQKYVSVGEGQIARISEEMHQAVQQMSHIRELENGQFRFSRNLSLSMEKVLGKYFSSKSADWLQIKEQLLLDEGTKAENLREEISATLRPYQQEGVAWLQAMHKVQFNCILADEMGLGKTIQTLAFLESRRSEAGKILILCPKSLTENWANEIKKFTPSFSSLIISGSQREELYEQIDDHQVIITSYATMRRDIQTLRKINFDFLVLDEAQNIKNVESQTAQACRLIQSKYKMLLSGTPLENSVRDLWSLFDFLLPGLLGREKDFLNTYNAEQANFASLVARIKPFILRRGKSSVDAQLPDKQEQIIYFNLNEEQKALYAAILDNARQVNASTGNKIKILAAITRLRQVCCFPQLLPNLESGQENTPSAKMDLLKEVILEAIGSGRRILLFSQFTKALKLIRQWLEEENIDFQYLDGQTKKRQDKVDQFNEGEMPIFLISLKAGGTGLNLTGADTVIHFDLWWNPMIEDQATDRAHRIGQTKSVTAIKLVARDTIEENILKLQGHKRKLFQQLIEASPDAVGSLTQQDLDFLLG